MSNTRQLHFSSVICYVNIYIWVALFVYQQDKKEIDTSRDFFQEFQFHRRQAEQRQSVCRIKVNKTNFDLIASRLGQGAWKKGS